MKEAITKYKVSHERFDFITKQREISSLIFDTVEEAKKWIHMADFQELEVAITPVKGHIGRVARAY